MITRRHLGAAATLSLLLPVAARAQGAAEALDIIDPWARASLRGRNSAAYMTIVNNTESLDRLLSAASPVARAVELHTHLMEEGVMRMRPVQAIEVNVGEPAVLRPGGLHVMLIGLVRDLRPGERIALTLRFEKAGERTVEVPVLHAGAAAPGRHSH
ncbi:MAG: copper chaperone PCu(A)C [Acetobacteraceae bacterium]